MGYLYAYSAMTEDLQVTYMPSYGAEVRGGTANCTIVVSDEEIASPIASSPDNLVILNNPSLTRFQNFGRPGGNYIINTTLVHGKLMRDDVAAIELPASEIAENLGDLRNTNMILLGAFIAVTEIVSMRTMFECIETVFARKNRKVIDANRVAFQAGYDYVSERKPKTQKAKK
jgi:2-oxoglutarate ferredoxin oxidoreductase subunit gamma